MASDEDFWLGNCRTCGGRIPGPRPARGPVPRYCSQQCRQRAFRARRQRSIAREVVGLVRSAPDSALLDAVLALSAGSGATLQRVLRRAIQVNLSPASGDGLCSRTTTAADAVVVPLHKEG
jgi:hypothetical protein